MRNLKISAELLVDLFTEGKHRGYEVKEDALPKDSEIRAVSFDGQTLVLSLSSKEFVNDTRDIVPVITTVP
jgi:hypothetical protein